MEAVGEGEEAVGEAVALVEVAPGEGAVTAVAVDIPEEEAVCMEAGQGVQVMEAVGPAE